MANKNGKKIIVKTEKKYVHNSQKTIQPLPENFLDVWDNYSRMYYDNSWTKPWLDYWMNNHSMELSPDANIKLIPVDIIDTGKGYQIIAEMPGINKKNIEVLVTTKNISICGETEINIKKENEGIVRKERGYSKLCRFLRFPENINPTKSEAILNDGILQININKKNPSKKGIIVPIK